MPTVLHRFVAPTLERYELTRARMRFIHYGDYREYVSVDFEDAMLLEGVRYVRIEPGVLYKVDTRTVGELTYDLGSIGFRHVMMLDWDWPDIGHKSDLCVTITCLDDVLRILEGTKDTWRVYVTPGGVRAFCVNRAVHPSLVPSLKADELYVEMCKKTHSYWARVTPKLEREHDWVAYHVVTIGDNVDPEIEDYVTRYHDGLIYALRGPLTEEMLLRIKAVS